MNNKRGLAAEFFKIVSRLSRLYFFIKIVEAGVGKQRQWLAQFINIPAA